MKFSNPFQRARVVGPGINPKLYHAQTAARGDAGYVMSRSDLMEFLLCPSRWQRGFRRKDSEAMDWGSLIDCLLLEPETFDQRYAVTPENYPVEPNKRDLRTEKPWSGNAIFCQEWKAEMRLKGLEVIDAKELWRARAAVRWLQKDEEIARLLDNCQRSVWAEAHYMDTETGLSVPVKILIDVLPDVAGRFGRGLADLKTCESAHPKAWRKSVFNFNYHAQAALYLDVYTAATGEDRLEFYHAVQESYEPFECGRKMLGERFLELGRLKYLTALRLYAECRTTGHWPTYDPSGATVIRGWEVTEPELWMVEQS